MTATAPPRAAYPANRRRQRPNGPLFNNEHSLALDDELEDRLQAAALAARLSPIALVRSILASTLAHLPVDGVTTR